MSAAVWDEWNEHESPRHPNRHVVEFVQRNFTIPAASGTQALDLGCGGGADARFLLECGFDVTAVDASSIGIVTTQARVRDLPGVLDVQQARLSEFQVPPRSYACVISVGALDAAGIDEARIAVPRLVDALRPGGKALLVFASEGDYRVDRHPDLRLHGYSRREVEALIVLEFGTSAWIDTCTVTYQQDSMRQIDWLVTLAKR